MSADRERPRRRPEIVAIDRIITLLDKLTETQRAFALEFVNRAYRPAETAPPPKGASE